MWTLSADFELQGLRIKAHFKFRLQSLTSNVMLEASKVNYQVTHVKLSRK